MPATNRNSTSEGVNLLPDKQKNESGSESENSLDSDILVRRQQPCLAQKRCCTQFFWSTFSGFAGGYLIGDVVGEIVGVTAMSIIQNEKQNTTLPSNLIEDLELARFALKFGFGIIGVLVKWIYDCCASKEPTYGSITHESQKSCLPRNCL